jgi:hypothetical protein
MKFSEAVMFSEVSYLLETYSETESEGTPAKREVG